MAIALSLLSAVAYGVSDFLGGIFARRATPWQVAVVGQGSSTVCAVAATSVLGWHADRDATLWAMVAGLGGGVGAVFLYRGLATARMSVVAPLSAVGAALLPVVVGLGLGERPTLLAVLGIVAAFPAIALISRVEDHDPAHQGGVVDGILAGLGFGVLFVGLGRAGDDAGLAPLAISQATSVLAVVGLAVALRADWVPRDRLAWRAAVMGPLGSSAQGAFLYATHHGLLSVVSVISSLYPAATVVLAAGLLRERILRWQGVGLALATVAVVLVVVG